MDRNFWIYVVHMARFMRDYDGTVIENKWNLEAFRDRDRAIEFVRQKKSELQREYTELGQRLYEDRWIDHDKLDEPNDRDGWLFAEFDYDEDFIKNGMPFAFRIIIEPMVLK